MTELHQGSELDGNAMAGDLREIFAVDVIATLRLWGPAPGQVGRCPHCDDVVLRMVTAPGRVFLDLRGTVRLELPTVSP